MRWKYFCRRLNNRILTEIIEVTLDDQGDAWNTKKNQNIKNYNVKNFKIYKNNSLKSLENFLNKRKTIQRNQTSLVGKIINDKKMVTTQFWSMKKFSKINQKLKTFFTQKELKKFKNR